MQWSFIKRLRLSKPALPDLLSDTNAPTPVSCLLLLLQDVEVQGPKSHLPGEQGIHSSLGIDPLDPEEVSPGH